MGGRGQDRTNPGDGGVSVDLVGLASGTASYKSVDKGGQTRPSVVMLNQVNSAEITAMSSCRGAVQGAYQILASWFWNVKMTLEVQGTIQKCPILAGHARKERGMLRHSISSILDQQISVGNLICQLHIQGTNQNIRESRQHGNGGVVERGINLITVRKCTSWTHLRTGMVVPHEVIVLHEHRPPSLSLGEILRRLEVCQVPMIHGDGDGDRVFGASEILAPFLEGTYDCKKFAIIDVVISLSWSESLRIVGAGVEIPIAILLHQHSTRGDQ